MSIEEGKIERFNGHDSSLCEIWIAEQSFLDQLDAETNSIINEFLSMFDGESFGDQLDDGEQVDAKEPRSDEINGNESENLKVNEDETVCKKTTIKVGSEFVVGIAGGTGFELGADRNLDLDLAETFVVFDGNGDGLITAEDLQFVMCSLGLQEGQTAADCQNMFHQVVMNSDGMVDYTKFMEMKALSDNGIEKDAEEADPFGLDQIEVKRGKKAMDNILQKEGVAIDWKAWKRFIRSVPELRLKPCNVSLFSK